MAPPKHAAVAPVEEDGFRRASMDRFHVGAGICGRRRIWGAKVLRRWPQWHAAPWARSQSQTKQQPPPAGERQVHDRAVALVKGLQRSPAMVEGLDHPVEAAEEESPVAPREDDRGQVLDREVVQAADRAGVRVHAQHAVVVGLDDVQQAAAREQRVRDAVGLAVAERAAQGLVRDRVGRG